MTPTLPFTEGLVSFGVFVENTLGWVPAVTEKRPIWLVRTMEAGKLKAKIKTNPGLYTWENLALTVEYCRRKHQSVASPAAVCWFVEDALKEAYQPTVADAQQKIDEAIAWERDHQYPDWEDWIGRLVRAGYGEGQHDVLAMWFRAGRG